MLRYADWVAGRAPGPGARGRPARRDPQASGSPPLATRPIGAGPATSSTVPTLLAGPPPATVNGLRDMTVLPVVPYRLDEQPKVINHSKRPFFQISPYERRCILLEAGLRLNMT